MKGVSLRDKLSPRDWRQESFLGTDYLRVEQESEFFGVNTGSGNWGSETGEGEGLSTPRVQGVRRRCLPLPVNI